MCIVVVSPKGQQFPDVTKIQNCVDSNPDGFAMSWNEDGEVKSYKTMGHKAIVAYYKKFIKTHDPMDTGLVFHARIATHGSKNIKNCHCWVSDGLGFAHNGILSIANRGDMTDSETFFQDIFLPVYRTCGWGGAEKAVNAVIGTSKFAFIDGDGTVYGFGPFKMVDGNYYSNDSYLSWEERYPSYYYGRTKGTTALTKSCVANVDGSDVDEPEPYTQAWWAREYPEWFDDKGNLLEYYD